MIRQSQERIENLCSSSPQIQGCSTRRSLVALLTAGFIPPYRAFRELQPQVKAASCPWLAIDHSSRLRELARQRGKQRFFVRLPQPLGHHPSAVGADVTRERPFGNTWFLRCSEVHGDRHREPLLNSPVKKHSTKIRWWSGGIHVSLEFAQRKGWVCSLRVLHPPSLASFMPPERSVGK